MSKKGMSMAMSCALFSYMGQKDVSADDMDKSFNTFFESKSKIMQESMSNILGNVSLLDVRRSHVKL